MTALEEVVIELDKRIEKMRQNISTNPTELRKGIKMGYEDARELVQQARKEKGELR
jgi:hypothetical protein